MVEAERRAAACVFQGFSGEGLIMAVDETEINPKCIIYMQNCKKNMIIWMTKPANVNNK